MDSIECIFLNKGLILFQLERDRNSARWGYYCTDDDSPHAVGIWRDGLLRQDGAGWSYSAEPNDIDYVYVERLSKNVFYYYMVIGV